MDCQHQTTPYSNNGTIQKFDKNPNESLSSVFNNKIDITNSTNTSNHLKTSTGIPKSPMPSNNTSTKSLMSFFMGQPNNKSSNTNGSISPGSLNNSAHHYPEFDLSYITPRLIVMTTPRDNPIDASSRSKAELIRDFLDTKHGNSYMLYSLDQTSNDDLPYRRELFHNRVVDLPLFNEKQSPCLIVLLWFCQKITLYLLESSSNVVVLHCNDGKNPLAYGACSLLAYHEIFSQVDQIIQYYEFRRCSNTLLTMSQKRYIQYLCDLSFGVTERPHFNELTIKSINISPIPLVNRHKTSCRPFVDIYNQEHKKIFSTYQDKTKLRNYSSSDNTCIIPVNISFIGDLTIHITHATLGQSRQTHENGIRICELTINSNFSKLNNPELIYLRNELDGIDKNEKNPTLFTITIDLINSKKALVDKQDDFLKQFDKTLKQPLTLFQDKNQLKQIINEYEKQIKLDDMIPTVIRRSLKVKDDPKSPNSSTSTSPRNSKRYSSAPQSPSSFLNPLLNPFKQQFETNQFKSQIISTPSTPLIEDKPSIGNLLNFDGSSPSSFERSISSDKQKDFNSSHDSQTNLMDDDFITDHFHPPTNLLTPSSIKINENLHTKLSTPTQQLNKTSTKDPPNYNVKMPTNNTSSSQSQSKPDKTIVQQKSKYDLNKRLEELMNFPQDQKPKDEPQPSSNLVNNQKVDLAKDIDPTILKIQEWTKDKKKNIRALLCSLSEVTWPECTWTGCRMNELLTNEQVTKVYRKAVIHIHPDKLCDDPNQPLAKLIFVELNEAWAKFQQELK